MSNKLRHFVAVTGMLALLSVGPAQAAQFFRYKDATGTLVLSHSIPAARVKYGYDIVDENSTLIRRVAPQLSDDEYQRKVAREKAQAECDEAVRRVKNLYQTAEDIDYAEQKQLASIDTSIANAKANLSHVRNQRRELEAQAAQRDLEGKAIPNALLDNITRARSQEQNLTDEIDVRLGEKLEQRIQYRFDRQVFELATCDAGLPARDIAANP
ncbi:MAG: hypothetical protein AAF993_08965 [Pseudomonadota bacterium]